MILNKKNKTQRDKVREELRRRFKERERGATVIVIRTIIWSN